MDLPPGEKRHAVRRELWAILHEGHGRAGHAFNFALILLILLSVALIPLEFLPSVRHRIDVVQWIETMIVSLFTVEYVLRVYAAPRRLRYIFSFFGIVDLLSIMPFYAGIFGTEYVRVLRLIRFLKLTEIESAARNDEFDVMQKDVGLLSGENVELIVTKSPVVLFLGVIPPTIALTFGIGMLLTAGSNWAAVAAAIVLFFFALLFLWKAWLDFSYDVIYVTNYRLIFQNQHILGRSINQVNYRAITNVKPFYPSALSYVLRFGSLSIDTAAEVHGQIILTMVRRHEDAAHRIMQKCFAAQQGEQGVIPSPPFPGAGEADQSGVRP